MKHFSSNISKALSSTVEQDFEIKIQKINQILKLYLNKLKIWNSQAINRISINQFNDPDMKEETKRYIAIRDLIKEDREIEYLLKEGYAIIDILREFFTGEKITYAIGVEYYGKLYEGNLTLSQILKLAAITVDWKGGMNSLVKLRLSGSNKSQIINMLGKQEVRSSLYTQIRNFASSNKKYNKGNLYEAYKVMKYENGSNEIPPAIWSEDRFLQIYSDVTKNTQSFIKGGDFLNEQIKFFGDSVPSLASLSTIRNFCNFFVQLTNQFSGPSLIQGLQYYFLKQEAIQKAELDIDQYIKDQVDLILKNLNQI